MDLLFIGYSWLYLLKEAACSSDINSSFEAYKQYEDEAPRYSVDQVAVNCSDYIPESASSCVCFECNAGRCILCCTIPWHSCCYCYGCEACWDAEWELITVTQISISILFLLGFIVIIILFFKLCHRCILVGNRCGSQQQITPPVASTQCCTIEGLRDRPPSYGEACGAPPLYSSPYNRASMMEAPPGYPGTPRMRDRGTDPVSSNVSNTYHI